MSWAALSIRAVRMDERGMDTRSEMEERGGERHSAAAQESGHSSRHRDTMESTMTCTNPPSITHHAFQVQQNKKADINQAEEWEREKHHLQFFISCFGKFSGQRVQPLSHRPVHRQHVGQFTQRGVQLEDSADIIHMPVMISHWPLWGFCYTWAMQVMSLTFNVCSKKQRMPEINNSKHINNIWLNITV